MNKLQLYISKSLRGFKSVRNINPSENVQRHIRDVRRALEALDYDPAEKYLFYLISYVEEGSFFTILRTIPDQPLDHLATTIFVPNGLKITREEMADIVHRTTRMVSNPSVSAEEINDLHEVFSKEYPVDPNPPACVPSEGRDYASCFYNGETGRKLDDFYAEALYQPAFIDYAGVLLVDSDLGVASSATDLTDMPLGTNVSLLPPDAQADGFVPHIFRHVFDRPFLVTLGSEITIVWKRGGFEDQTQTVAVKADGQKVEPVSNAESRKSLTPASFFITSQSSKAPVSGAVITVNGVEINEARTFTHDELKNADVIIRAAGFFPFRGRLDLAATTQALIQLQEQRKIYRFELPVKSSELGAPIHFEIHTKRELTDSPLEGYALLDDIKEGATRNNHLQYTGSAPLLSRRNVIIGCLAALVVGFLLGWLIMGGSSSKPVPAPVAPDTVVVESVQPVAAQVPAQTDPEPEKSTQKVEQPAAQSATPASTQVSREAIAYLDSHKAWNREEMEKLAGLQGLFDDMNNFRLERLENTWGVKLAASKTFKRVASHASDGRRKGIFKPKGTYCTKPGDTTITIQSYLNTIDPAKK